MPSITAVPSWLNEQGWQLNPTDATNGPFQAGHKTDLDMFGFALTNKEKFWDDMNTFFEGDRGSPHWAEWFPVQDKLLDNSILRPGAPVIVDVGGGRGHDIAGFRKHFPDLPGRLILQDQQPVLDSIIALDSSIEKHALDFFQRGACARSALSLHPGFF
ncbi:hypothetical protein BFW01_g7375 [Lasiodiplodia theobromae]|nr:hypothetical protein BFW01_g7375 [Lasiodiplodia theobromae]